jgi:hypothetical protein
MILSLCKGQTIELGRRHNDSQGHQEKPACIVHSAMYLPACQLTMYSARQSAGFASGISYALLAPTVSCVSTLRFIHFSHIIETPITVGL